ASSQLNSRHPPVKPEDDDDRTIHLFSDDSPLRASTLSRSILIHSVWIQPHLDLMTPAPYPTGMRVRQAEGGAEISQKLWNFRAKSLELWKSQGARLQIRTANLYFGYPNPRGETR